MRIADGKAGKVPDFYEVLIESLHLSVTML
jgi:hypothetical protein